MKVLGIGAHSEECHYGCGGTFALLNRLGCRHIVIGDRGRELYEGSRQDRALVMEQMEEFQPDLLFIMWPRDSHPEHSLTALCSCEAYLNSLWNGKLNSVCEIYAYEVGPNQNGAYFHPEFCINVTEVWPKFHRGGHNPWPYGSEAYFR